MDNRDDRACKGCGVAISWGRRCGRCAKRQRTLRALCNMVTCFVFGFLLGALVVTADRDKDDRVKPANTNTDGLTVDKAEDSGYPWTYYFAKAQAAAQVERAKQEAEERAVERRDPYYLAASHRELQRFVKLAKSAVTKQTCYAIVGEPQKEIWVEVRNCPGWAGGEHLRAFRGDRGHEPAVGGYLLPRVVTADRWYR